MQNARETARRLRDPKRRSPHINAVPLLAPIQRPPIVAGDSPHRVIGWRGNRPHLMPASAKPRSHLSRIFPDSRGLGCKVGTTNEDLHGFTFDLKPSFGATSENSPVASQIIICGVDGATSSSTTSDITTSKISKCNSCRSLATASPTPPAARRAN